MTNGPIYRYVCLIKLDMGSSFFNDVFYTFKQILTSPKNASTYGDIVLRCQAQLAEGKIKYRKTYNEWTEEDRHKLRCELIKGVSG